MYTTIIHPIRKEYDLSMNEYAILDTIYHLSNNVKYGGWCVMSKAKIGRVLDLSKQSIHKTINKLVELELVVREEKTKYVRTTDAWNNIIANKDSYILALKEGVSTKFTGSKESLLSTVKKVDKGSKESLHNNNTTNNNKDKDVDEVHLLNVWVKENCPNVCKLSSQLTNKECVKLVDTYGNSRVAEVLLAMDNFKPLTTKYVSVYRTCVNWCKARIND